MFYVLLFVSLLAFLQRALCLNWVIEILERCNYDLEHDTRDNYDLSKRSTNYHLLQVIDDLKDVRAGILLALKMVIPSLILCWLSCCLLGYGDMWDHFFPSWVSTTATTAGEWFADYILDNVLI